MLFITFNYFYFLLLFLLVPVLPNQRRSLKPLLRKENGVKLVKKRETPVVFFFFSFHSFAILTLVGAEISCTPHLNKS